MTDSITPYATPDNQLVVSNEAPHTSRLEAAEVFMFASPFLALSAAGVGVAGLLGRGPAFVRDRPVVAGLLACGGIAALFKTQFDRFLLERPDYEVEGEVNGLELRRYAPRVVAETFVDSASFDEAREAGFKRLAEYIFGENASSERMAMTTPVNVEPKKLRSKRGAAANPVTVDRSQAGYVMRFHMPKDRAVTSLPRPNDPRVVLRTLPAQRVAALRFRGTYAAEHIAEKQSELIERAKSAGLGIVGEPCFAGYDSPAALPALRRVEVWVRLR